MKIYKTDDFGALIRQRRTEMGLSQSQLSDISGSGTRFISDIENGKPTMQVGKVIDLLHVLGFDVIVTPREERTSC